MYKLYQLDINDCAKNPCQNHGACIDGVNRYTCRCAAGFIGSVCQTSESTILLINVHGRHFISSSQYS